MHLLNMGSLVLNVGRRMRECLFAVLAPTFHRAATGQAGRLHQEISSHMRVGLSADQGPASGHGYVRQATHV